MPQSLNKDALNQLFSEAHTHHHWLEKTVSDQDLKNLYEICKMGPTSMNSCPMRVAFVKSVAAKEKLYPALMGSNSDQVRQAPVCAIVAMDMNFYDNLPTLFPAFDAKPMFTSNAALTEVTALRNSSLEGAYFIMAARSLGLDCGPMSGFDNAKVDEAFFKGTPWKSNFLCNIGHGDKTKLYPRGPRLSFDQACKIL